MNLSPEDPLGEWLGSTLTTIVGCAVPAALCDTWPIRLESIEWQLWCLHEAGVVQELKNETVR